MESIIDSCPDPYHILELPHCADKQAIRKAHKKLNIECHPDKNRRPDANAVIHEINCARDKVQDPDQELSIDQGLGVCGKCSIQIPNDRVCGNRVTNSSSTHNYPSNAFALIRVPIIHTKVLVRCARLASTFSITIFKTTPETRSSTKWRVQGYIGDIVS